MIILAGFIVMLAGILLVVNRILKTQEEERENRMVESYIASVQESYGVAQERIEAVRRSKHDLAKHIRTLKQLMENEANGQEMKEYMKNLESYYQEMQKEQYCQDEIVNSILSIKKQQCEEKEISFEIHVENIFYQEIKDVDMVGLLYNLLDNAVEANERMPEGSDKRIALSMGKKENSIWIDIENSICPDKPVTFETDKDEPENHGIGTKIIKSTIEKYNGTKEIIIDQEKGLFREKIRLYMGV